MGRKRVTKKVEVEAEQSEEEQEVQEEKPKKGAKGKASFDLKDILSETFRGRLTQYIALNEEVLTLRGKDEGTDKTEQISERKKKVSERVESTSADILKLECGSLEEWIAEQQLQLSSDIVKLGAAYESGKANLQGTGAFTPAEIKTQLVPIQNKSSEKQATYDSYSALLRKSSNIYN